MKMLYTESERLAVYCQAISVFLFYINLTGIVFYIVQKKGAFMSNFLHVAQIGLSKVTRYYQDPGLQ
jgi:hypothetical protein